MNLGFQAVFSIPIARSTSSLRWPMTANEFRLQCRAISWRTFAGIGCGFTRSPAVREWLQRVEPGHTYNDRPDQSDPLNQKAYEIAGDDDTSRLFGYGGKVFFEHRSVGGADSHDHEIWQFGRDSAAKVCDYAVVQYRIEKVGRAVRSDEP